MPKFIVVLGLVWAAVIVLSPVVALMIVEARHTPERTTTYQVGDCVENKCLMSDGTWMAL